jgi:hypothetical protein
VIAMPIRRLEDGMCASIGETGARAAIRPDPDYASNIREP